MLLKEVYMANKNKTKAKDIALRLDYEFYNHKGKWLDLEAVTFYRKQLQDIYNETTVNTMGNLDFC